MNAKELVSELEFELISTEKLLRSIPLDKLSWKPHHKARSLGELALHVASIPARYLQYAKEGSTTVETLTERKMSSSLEEIISAFESGKEAALTLLRNDFDGMAETTWHLTRNSNNIFSLPAPFFTRLLVFNHLIHHRGELVMYLRSVDVLIPSIYGPSADENPFA